MTKDQEMYFVTFVNESSGIAPNWDSNTNKNYEECAFEETHRQDRGSRPQLKTQKITWDKTPWHDDNTGEDKMNESLDVTESGENEEHVECQPEIWISRSQICEVGWTTKMSCIWHTNQYQLEHHLVWCTSCDIMTRTMTQTLPSPYKIELHLQCSRNTINKFYYCSCAPFHVRMHCIWCINPGV